jgi:hypothetical protein
MKSIWPTLLFIFVATTPCKAQLTVGLKTGVCLPTNPRTSPILINKSVPGSELQFNAIKIMGDFTGGIECTMKANPFIIRTELLINQCQIRYEIVRIGLSSLRTRVQDFYSDKITQLDIPISIGVPLDFVEIYSGFTLHVTLEYDSTMKNISSCRQDLSDGRLGWHSGIRINLDRAHMEIRYQLDFNNYGQHLFMYHENLGLYNQPGRFSLMIGYSIN